LSWQGKLLREFGQTHGTILSLAYLADGKQIVSAGADDALVFQSGRTVASGHGVVNALAAGDGFLVSAGRDRDLRVWEPETGRLIRTLTGHRDSVYALTLSEDGTVLASGGRDCTVRLWDTSNWSESQVLRGHQDSVLAIAIAPDGQTLVSGSADGMLHPWNATREYPAFASGHRSIHFAAFAPDARSLVTGGVDGSVRTWRL
jgi:WD40 repeat protein